MKGNPGGKFSPLIRKGVRNNMLTVVRRLPKGDRGYKVLCKCDCGKMTSPAVSDFIRGIAKSCGCIRLKNAHKQSKENANTAYGKVIKGARFQKLVVIKRMEDERGRWTNKVKCKCDCGNVCIRTIDALVYGNTDSCGCLLAEMLRKRNKETGSFKGFSGKCPKTFAVWRSMKNRCGNPKQQAHKDYGAKGIRICKYIGSDPRNLVKLIGLKKGKASLDRFPIHDGNYSCGACEECKRNGWKLNIRWATRQEQSLNRGSFNVWITAFGKTMTKSQWCELSGLKEQCVSSRLSRGWDVERTLTTPDSRGICLDVTNV